MAATSEHQRALDELKRAFENGQISAATYRLMAAQLTGGSAMASGPSKGHFRTATFAQGQGALAMAQLMAHGP